MKVTRISEAPKIPDKKRPEDRIYTAGPIPRDQELVSDSKDFWLGLVHFGKGVRNKWHTHSCDQVLIVTEGEGFVETEKEKRIITVGDIVSSPAGEKHRHGANKDSTFSHIFITKPGSTWTQLED